jgi:CrcB protein
MSSNQPSLELSSPQPSSPLEFQSVAVRKIALGSVVFSLVTALAVGLGEFMGPYTTVAIGSALGGMARHWCTVVSTELLGVEFPWGTLLINVLGSFVIGFFFAIAGPGARFAAPADMRLFVMTGLCGGYTTFSAFSLQTLSLLQSGAWLRAGGYIASSVVLCLIAVAGGYVLARAIATLFS